ncbi:MAG: hypothetical protein AB1567_04310 [bacterium]
MEQNQEEILNFCLKKIDRLKPTVDRLNELRTKTLEYYHSKPYPWDKDLEGKWSTVITDDVKNAINWALPSLTRIFTGSKDVVSITAQGAEDEKKAKYMTELTNYQLQIKNNWEFFIQDLLFDTLLFGTGFAKVYWKKHKERVLKTYENLTFEEMQFIKLKPNVEILKEEERMISVDKIDEFGNVISVEEKIYNIEVAYTIEDEYPILENVAPEDIGFTANTKSLDNVDFIFHKIKRKDYEIKEIYGKDKDELQQATSEEIISRLKKERFYNIDIDEFYNKDDELYTIYECYFNFKSSVPMRAVICGNIFLEEPVENPYGRHPFFATVTNKVSHRLWGEALADYIKLYQIIRTDLIRQFLNNVNYSNNSVVLIDKLKINPIEFRNNRFPGGIVTTEGLGGYESVNFPPMQPWVFSLFELITQERDATGISRYSQGLDPNTLNKTARGVLAIMQASQQRLELMARIFGVGIARIVNFVVDLNIKYFKKTQSIRLFNKWIEISPENIIGRYDISVNAGIGGNEQIIITQMQQLLGLFTQIGKFGIPIISPQNVYNVMKELIEAMGKKNVSDFITEPIRQEDLQALFERITMFILQGNMDAVIGGLKILADKLGIQYQGMATQKGEQVPPLPLEASQPSQPEAFFNLGQELQALRGMP